MVGTVTPFLMFNDQVEEAVQLYVSTIKNSKILSMSRQGQDGPVISATFVLDGQEFVAYNGGPHFKFSDGFSIFVSCETQAEVDRIWQKLAEGGQEVQCGWLTDKFGVSWQIVPTVLMQLLADPDPRKSEAVMQAMLKMVKLDIAGLQRAYEQA